MGKVQIEVANPVAESVITRIEPATRLSDLDGKRVGLYWNFKPGGDFGLDQVAIRLAERFPTATFHRFDGTIGATVKHVTPDQGDEIAAAVDAVVGTTGDCGGCTSWLVHDMKELEKRGIPTVALVSEDFVDDHRRTSESYGIAELPFALMSAPLVSQSEKQVRDIVDGAIDGVLAGLLEKPETTTPRQEVLLDREPWFTFTGSDQLTALAEMNERLLEWQYGDGLPLVPATRAAVEEILTGTTRSADDVVGFLEPGVGAATVEKIAINAVMAGCQPRHLPIVIAAVEALCDHRMDTREKAISTGPAAPMIMVNGRAREHAGLNTTICMLGPGAPSRSNTVIGRAVRLCMMNIGHTYPTVTDMDTIGSPNKYSMCLAENEERLGPWAPYHTDHGLTAEESAVTVGFVYGLNDITDYHSLDPETVIWKFAMAAKYLCVTSTGFWLAGNRGNPQYGNVEREHHYLLLAPQHARIFLDHGWTRRDISEALYRESRLPFKTLASRLEHSAIRTAHPELGWLWDSPEALVPVLESADCFEVMITGSPGSNRSSWAWGQGGPLTKPVLEADLAL